MRSAAILLIILLLTSVAFAQDITGFFIDDVINFFAGFFSTACVHADPGISISPNVQGGEPGEVLEYMVTVQNNDNSQCSSTTFSLSCSVASGWACNTNPCPALGPGSTCTSAIEVTPPSTETKGIYDVVVTATNNADTTKTNVASTIYKVTDRRSPCSPHGDVNNDGFVTAADGLLILQYKAGTPLDDWQVLRADTDADGDADPVDNLNVLRYEGGLDDTLPICDKIFVNLTTNVLVENIPGTVNIDVTSNEGLIDVSNVSIRHTTFSPQQIAPVLMTCPNSDQFVAQCSYDVTPVDTLPNPWLSPMDVMIQVGASTGAVRLQEGEIMLVTTTTTTTLAPTTTTTQLGPTTTTTTTTTTIPPTGMVIDITTTDLLRNAPGNVDVNIGSNECRININDVNLRHTTFTSIQTAPKLMQCPQSDTCIAKCTLVLTPGSDWIDPMTARVIVGDTLGGADQEATETINLLVTTTTTTSTTTTTQPTTTTTQPGATTTTTQPGATTTTTSTTTTTLPIDGVIMSVENQNVTKNVANEIKVILGDDLCRLDKNRVDIRHTKFLGTIKTEPQAMSCDDGTCVMECTYTLTPEDDWTDPLEFIIIADIGGQELSVEESLDILSIVATPETTTTTTLPGATTTTQPGATTSTTIAGGTDLTVIIPDLNALKQDLLLVKIDVDDLADRLRNSGDARYNTYRSIALDISSVIDDIDSIIVRIEADPTSETNKARVIDELIDLKDAIQQIINRL